ncbi:hypothetical protein OIK40_03045 [Erythrobacter sp. sf7]|uniref:TonB-dependent receptor-like beta-barrel domain-containing protein n=1 Tax=Erythrobacter fulvus TaxID=2987523 RepID=A0ABT5JM80_9SPHN|nr:hypothetical protein [Erythrobacter fulvus]MDC8753614.1 hypothetical protein [Erythrobacter fulvus]
MLTHTGKQPDFLLEDHGLLRDLTPGSVTLGTRLFSQPDESPRDALATFEARDAFPTVVELIAPQIQADFGWDGKSAEPHLKSRPTAGKLGAPQQSHAPLNPLENVEVKQATASLSRGIRAKTSGEGGAGAIWAEPKIAYAPLPLDAMPGEIEVTYGTAVHALHAAISPIDLRAGEPLPVSIALEPAAARDFVAPRGHGWPAPPLSIRLPNAHPRRLEQSELLEVRITSQDPTGFTSDGEDADAQASSMAPAVSFELASANLAQTGELPSLNLPFGSDNAPAKATLDQDIGPLEGWEGQASLQMASAPLADEAAPRTDKTAMNMPEQIRLGALVELLSERFDPVELERFRRSPAFEANIPVSLLEQAGILVASNPVSDTVAINLAGMQSSPTGSAGLARGGEGGGTNGFLGLNQSLVATASAGFDSNPFLGGFDDTSAASIRFQLAPSLSRSSERNTFRLSGRVEHIEYLGRYESLQNFGADLAASHRATERLEIDGGLLLSSNVLATNLANPFFVDDLAPDVPLPPTGNDITVLGQGQRRTQFGADAGLTYTMSERDQLRWSLTGRADRFEGDGLIESNFLAQQLQYSRQLDEGLSIGAIVDASLIDFIGASGGSARTITPQLQVRADLSPRLEVTGSVGAAITRLEFGDLEDTTTAVAGNLSLCNRGERSNLCVNGSRQVLPAAIGGALLQTTAGFSYSLQVSERDTLQFSGNYATASQPVTNVVGPNDFESINGFVRYERQLDERLRLFVSGGYLNTTGNLPGGATNVQGLVGITFNLGRSR